MTRWWWAVLALLLVACAYNPRPHWEDYCTFWMLLPISTGKTTTYVMTCFQWEHVWVVPEKWQ